jgi:hypothetical protein
MKGDTLYETTVERKTYAGVVLDKVEALFFMCCNGDSAAVREIKAKIKRCDRTQHRADGSALQ